VTTQQQSDRIFNQKVLCSIPDPCQSSLAVLTGMSINLNLPGKNQESNCKLRPAANRWQAKS